MIFLLLLGFIELNQHNKMKQIYPSKEFDVTETELKTLDFVDNVIISERNI